MGVVCRGQREIDSGASFAPARAVSLSLLGLAWSSWREMPQTLCSGLEAAASKERRFFESRSQYASLLDRCGARCLARRLSELLVEATARHAPSLRLVARERLAKAERLQASFGPCGASAEEPSVQAAFFHNNNMWLEECDLSRI